MTSEFSEPNISFDNTNVRIVPITPEEPEEQPEESEEPAQQPIVNQESDLMVLSSGLWSLPKLIFDKLEPLPPEQVEAWNRQLFIYCEKKGIDPFEYLFDELGMVFSTLTLGTVVYRDYKLKYPKQKRKDNGGKEYEHQKKLNEEEKEVVIDEE